jgi:hypothetical protein
VLTLDLGNEDKVALAFPHWRGLPIIPSDHADDACFDLNLDYWDIAALLEASVKCKDSRRGKNKEDRCAPWKGKTLRVIVAQTTSGWVEGPCWVVINIKPI